MKRYALVLALATTALLSGCGDDATTQSTPATARTPEATVTTTPARPTVTATPVRPDAGSATPRAAKATAAPPLRQASGRPSNALSWSQPDLANEDLDRAVRITWAAKHGVAPNRVRGDQLLLGLADNGGLMVGAYQLWVPGGQAHVVVAQSERASEPSIIVDTLSRADLPAVAGVASRRSADVVAAVAPGTTRVEYRAHASAAWVVVEQDSLDLVFPRGAAHGPGEALRTTRRGVQAITSLHARRVDGVSSPSAPENVLAWPGRGAGSDGPAVDTVAKAYAQARNARTAHVRRLYSGNTDSGVRYLIGQAWVTGGPAHTVGYVLQPSGEGELMIQPKTPQGARAVGLLLTSLPGTSTDLLIVVPEPRTTQVSYRQSSTAPWRPGYTDATLDGVNLIDRAKNASGDTLQIMTGNGDPTSPTTLIITVARLLCAGPSCS